MEFNNCGTNAGYRKHILAKEKSCEPCRLAMNEYNRLYRIKNLEKIKAIDKKRRDLKPGLRLELNRKYREKYRERVREQTRKDNRKRRVSILNNIHSPYTELQVIELYGEICHICNEKIDMTASRWVGRGNWQYGLHIDHLISISKGGSDTLDNVRPAHGLCNLQKSNN